MVQKSQYGINTNQTLGGFTKLLIIRTYLFFKQLQMQNLDFIQIQCQYRSKHKNILFSFIKGELYLIGIRIPLHSFTLSLSIINQLTNLSLKLLLDSWLHLTPKVVLKFGKLKVKRKSTGGISNLNLSEISRITLKKKTSFCWLWILRISQIAQPKTPSYSSSIQDLKISSCTGKPNYHSWKFYYQILLTINICWLSIGIMNSRKSTLESLKPIWKIWLWEEDSQ